MKYQDFLAHLQTDIKKRFGSSPRVLVGGCFDLFHYGHLSFLKGAKRHAAILIVALESDQFIEKNKQRAPIHTQKERSEVLEALSIVDYVVSLPYLQSYDEYRGLVEAIHPSVIAISGNDPQRTNKEKQAQLVNAKIEVVPDFIAGLSTTAILQKNRPLDS